MKKSKTLALFLVMVLSLTLLLPACSNPAEPPKPSTGEKAPPATPAGDASKAAVSDKDTKAAPSSGNAKTFVTSGYFDPPPAFHGNVFAPSGIGSSGNISDFVFERLFEYVPYPQPTFIPMLGHRYVEQGNKTIITLRPGVVWSDGKPFTSKDVLCNYYMGFMAGWPMWKYVDKIDAPNNDTVEITWRKPGPILTIMAFANFVHTPYHIYGKWADQLAPLTAKRDAKGDMDQATRDAVAAIREDLYKFKPTATEVVTTGPYLVSNVTASEAIMVKNPKYRDTTTIKIDNIKLQRYVSQEAWLSTVMKKGYDGEPHGASPDVFKQLQQNNPKMKIMWIPEYSQPSFQFNVSKYPVDNPEIRKAITYAVNREALLPIAEPGTQMPDTYSSGLVPSVRDAWADKAFLDKLTNYTYNPAKAEELLKKNGWKKGSDGLWQDSKGQTPTIEVASMNSWPIFFLCGDALVNQLKDFGFKAEFKAMELSAYWDYINNGNAIISADFRAGVGSYGYPWEAYRNLYIDGAVRLGFKDPKAGPNDPVNVKITLSDNREVNPVDLIDDLFYEMDKNKQKEIVRTLMQATNEFCPLLPIGEKTAPWKLYNDKLTGYPDDTKAPEWFGGAGMRPISKLIRLGKLYYKD